MYKKVLIANRGEIALRILRTLREMGIGSVAVYSDADREARFVLEADESYRIGPATPSESYLSQRALVETAKRARVEAVHPGYGFLAENAEFAQAVAAAGLTFIGPSPDAMRLMGDKIGARKAAVGCGVPVVPGTDGAVRSPAEAREFVAEHGLPILVKAGGGGGGRGIRVVDREELVEESLEAASREAAAYFDNPDVYLERFYERARHIEVQIVGDSMGAVAAWGERDCSTQRRRQKLIEETPAPGLEPNDRSALFAAAEKLAETANYVGVGTVEFLYAVPGDFYFLEMNTRIQVEHTITEEVLGLDLVRESVLLSLGETATRPVEARGHAIEARINAEDPAQGFRPGPGQLRIYREPGGPGVRVDSGVYQGFTIPGDYDSLVSKLIVHAPTRDLAIERMLRALRDFRIEGVPTTIPLIRSVIASRAFRDGEVTTDWLDQNLSSLVGAPQEMVSTEGSSATARTMDMEVNGRRFQVRVYGEADKAAGPSEASRSGRRRHLGSKKTNRILSPMRGTVLSIHKEPGDGVEEGERVAVVEAMKMENEVRSPRDGTVSAVLVDVGQTVENHQALIDLE